MNSEEEIRDRLRQICRRDNRYALAAYTFVQSAVLFTQERMNREKSERKSRHIDGHELLQGIREYALEEFGPLAKTVFNDWGIYKTRDFGDIVFNMVGAHLLGARESDAITDFEDAYTFDDAFVAPFVPQGPPPKPPVL